MLVRTRWTIPMRAEELWPLLCDSRMELAPRCPLFFLGVPQPHQCRLPEGPGEVGATRQCVSEQGTVHQRITEWEPPRRLAFRMESTDLGFHGYVSALSDLFELGPAHGGAATIIRRTTTVTAQGSWRPVKSIVLWFGLKTVHRFVFRNWRHQNVSG